MISFPNAKINLGLDVVERRNDGYHNISSCFYPIPLKDILEINLSHAFSFNISGIQIPGDPGNNLVVKAYKILKNDFNLSPVSIHLHKNIPMQSGLGGGSSDGAYALQMLNELFELFLDDSVISEYASMLGSDCPFFVYNVPSIISGRGEDVEEIDLDLKGYYICIIKPDISISTQDAYQNIQPGIPAHPVSSILSDQEIGNWKEVLKNDFEKVIFNLHPGLSELKSKIYEMGALYVSMSGSGSAFYGIFKDPPSFKGEFPQNYFYWVGNL
jgi:4-diphosphocytidyl-2-C-methyl-D-erythritol kinase